MSEADYTALDLAARPRERGAPVRWSVDNRRFAADRRYPRSAAGAPDVVQGVRTAKSPRMELHLSQILTLEKSCYSHLSR